MDDGVGGMGSSAKRRVILTNRHGSAGRPAHRLTGTKAHMQLGTHVRMHVHTCVRTQKWKFAMFCITMQSYVSS